MLNISLEIDHYHVLGLPSGYEGAKLSEAEIATAYKKKAVVLHPDKRPNDTNACANFIALKNSYDILSDPIQRELYDAWNRINARCYYTFSVNKEKRRKEKTTPMNNDAKVGEEIDKIRRIVTKIMEEASGSYYWGLAEKKISKLKSRIGTWKAHSDAQTEKIEALLIFLDSSMDDLKFGGKSKY